MDPGRCDALVLSETRNDRLFELQVAHGLRPTTLRGRFFLVCVCVWGGFAELKRLAGGVVFYGRLCFWASWCFLGSSLCDEALLPEVHFDTELAFPALRRVGELPWPS